MKSFWKLIEHVKNSNEFLDLRGIGEKWNANTAASIQLFLNDFDIYFNSSC